MNDLAPYRSRRDGADSNYSGELHTGDTGQLILL
jgi:hypothetical protein